MLLSKQVQIAGYTNKSTPARVAGAGVPGYFHSIAAYAILRQNGMGLGKRDFTSSVPELGL